MRRRLVIGILGVALVAAVACALIYRRGTDKVFPPEVRVVLDAPDHFEFFTIDPSFENFDPKRPGTMHGYAILGHTMITDAPTQKRLVEEVYDMVKRVDPDGPVPGCMFQPRHAIRVTRGAQVVDLLVCFQCGQLEVFAGDRMVSGSLLNEAGMERDGFDAVAKDAGLKVATRPQELRTQSDRENGAAHAQRKPREIKYLAGFVV